VKKVGSISKMVVEATTPVSYALPVGNELIPLNPFLGETLKLQFTHQINCVACQRTIKKSYQDGYCFPCTQSLAQCDFCIVKPERCHFHEGTCRDPEWGQKQCMSSHVVYLSNASGVKVGITRKTQVPTRWIDQGAITALPIFEVPTRRVSGFVEVIMAKTFSDKTNWRKMLTGHDESIDLFAERDKILSNVDNALASVIDQFGANAIIPMNASLYQFEFPVLEYPKKITSLSFDKTDLIEGTLLGIKGQYLIFDIGVINMRKHSGYVIALEQ
jgi:hypothetical protein